DRAGDPRAGGHCRSAVPACRYQAGPGQMSDSDLYGDDIRLWSERQGALLRRLSAGEAVSDQVDWQHVVGEIEDLGHDYVTHDEVARLTARLAAAEAEVNELRARLEALTGKLADTQTELANTQN